MQLSIIIGSSRKNSQSQKVAKFISSQPSTGCHYQKVHLVNLHELNLSLWQEDAHSSCTAWTSVSKQLTISDALIIITPEWDGMACPALKNLFNYCRNGELQHKPALLIAVSTGQGGSYPIAELRMSSYKNSKICYIPEQIIVRESANRLNKQRSIGTKDQQLRDRITFSLNVLSLYANALISVRSNKVIKESTYPNGM